MKLEIRGLHKSFQDAAATLVVLDDVNIELGPAASIAIVGKSGVGKSTFLNLLGGLERPDAGAVKYDSTDIFALSSDELALFRGEHVGFVFQFHHLLPEFDALENVAMPLIISGTYPAEAEERANEILKRVGLGERLRHRPSQLSGGEQQRVAMARAVVCRPDVILADEPTGNLDAATSRGIQDLLLELREELDNVLVVVTHNLELARSMSCVFEMLPGGALRQLREI